jgi:hypothetical protein
VAGLGPLCARSPGRFLAHCDLVHWVADAATNGKRSLADVPRPTKHVASRQKVRRQVHEQTHRLSANCRPGTPLTRIQEQSDVPPQTVLILPCTAGSPTLGLTRVVRAWRSPATLAWLIHGPPTRSGSCIANTRAPAHNTPEMSELDQAVLFEQFVEAREQAIVLADRFDTTAIDNPSRVELSNHVMRQTDTAMLLLERWLRSGQLTDQSHPGDRVPSQLSQSPLRLALLNTSAGVTDGGHLRDATSFCSVMSLSTPSSGATSPT